MSGRKVFIRKVTYLCLMAGLLVPLYWVSNPATTSSPGGTLSRMRTQYGISPAELGEIDPAGASMSLATLGMRGIAANLLWGRAIHYQKVENFDALQSTLNQITKLQPNFVAVWKFQAWNLSYNVSVEFDDYRHRFEWVKKGISFLIKGTHYNRDDSRLMWDVGWFFGHKMGRSDEYRQFRRLFREDKDFHAELAANDPENDPDAWYREAAGPDNKPDNWKVAHRWYAAGQNVVDTKNRPLRGQNPLNFHSWPAKALMSYATAIEEEGVFGEKGRQAWKVALDAWLRYGERNIPTSTGLLIRLNDLELQQERAAQKRQELDELVPGAREQILEEKQTTLSDDERVALNLPEGNRSPEQYSLASEAKDKLKVTDMEVAEQAPADVRLQAGELAREASEAENNASFIQRYRGIVNFEYWLTRAQAEQEDLTVAAHKDLFDANEAFQDGRLIEARAAFDSAWDKWSDVFEKYPLLADDTDGEDIVDQIKEYVRLLGQLDEQLPADFTLGYLLEMHDASYYRDVVAPSFDAPTDTAPTDTATADVKTADEG
ncbi:MAG: hypothetical protein KDA99_01075, partial [Planctomycetales bacterium]|nr:hypothetical protein [Planctomycetales bacterium]